MKELRSNNILLIQQYLEGKLDPKRMHELERQALDDPFLADAIEGYSGTKKPVDRQLSILQRQLEERIALQQEKKNYFHFTWFRLSVAAAAGLMFITVGLLFKMNTRDNASKSASAPGKVDVQLSPELDPNKKQEETIAPKNNILAEAGKTGPALASNTNKIKAAETQPRQEVATMQAGAAASAMPLAASRTTSLKSSDNILQGKVTDTQGAPLPGTSVRLSSGLTVETDVKGEFVLPDSLRGTLNVAHIGYKSQQLSLNSSRNIEIKLAPVATTLDEVVVTSYGVQSMGLTTELFRAQPAKGWSSFKEYLDTNLRYPQMEVNVAGDVIVGFTIDSQKRPTNVRIIQSLNALCNAEAMRLIRQGPDWEIVDPTKPPEIRVTVNFHP